MKGFYKIYESISYEGYEINETRDESLHYGEIPVNKFTEIIDEKQLDLLADKPYIHCIKKVKLFNKYKYYFEDRFVFLYERINTKKPFKIVYSQYFEECKNIKIKDLKELSIREYEDFIKDSGFAKFLFE